jgi:hypothetical protein
MPTNPHLYRCCAAWIAAEAAPGSGTACMDSVFSSCLENQASVVGEKLGSSQLPESNAVINTLDAAGQN